MLFIIILEDYKYLIYIIFMHLMENDMKKLFVMLLFLILPGCADDEVNNSAATPIVSENPLVLGINQVNYNKSKTFNTLIYHVQANADDNDYIIKNSYIIFANEKHVQYIKPAHHILPKTFDVGNSIKEKINDINKNLQQFTYDNNIMPINQNSSILKRTIPQIIKIGTKWENINLLNVNNNTFSTINATCIAVSKYAYFFLQDGLSNLTDEQINAVTTAFDKDYAIIHKYYGEETDTDGNGKVSFLIADFPQYLLGFFYTADKYRLKDLPDNIKSNEADVLYVNHYYFRDNNWVDNEINLKATFIHEFQHMVLFDSRSRHNLNPNLNTWLNEGLSMLSEYYGGYAAPHYRYISSYFDKKQGISLITNNSSQDYGLSCLFMRYLQIRFGDDVIKKIYLSKYTGMKAVEEAVNMNFNELFLDFTKMILVTGRNITTDTRYNIKEFNYPEDSDGYNKNGFNLASLIDEVYSYNRQDSHFITYSGYNNKQISMYGFVITKWNGNIDNITLSGSDGIAGMYAAW